MTNFGELLEALQTGKTFQELMKENTINVECVNNEVYEDNHLYEFLTSIGAEIEDFGVGYALINANDKIYEVPYECRKNRFGSDLTDETVLFFDVNRMYDVTDNYL